MQLHPSSLTPVAVSGNLRFRQLAIATIDAGSSHTCAIAIDGKAFCWGDWVGVASGNGSTAHKSPVAVAGTRKWAFCWGRGSAGDLGNGSEADHFTPVAVSGGHTFIAISASFVFACGLDQDRQAWCWGTNDNGQLGDGTGTNSSIPVAVAGS